MLNKGIVIGNKITVGIRQYIDNHIVGDNENRIRNKYKTFKDYIEAKTGKQGELSLFNLIATGENGDIINILGDYTSWKLANPQFFSHVTFNVHKAAYLAYNPHLISYHVYGNIDFYYLIMLFNDILSSADLSEDRLLTEGLLVLNETGLDALKKIINLRKYMEQTEEDVNPFVPENGDDDYDY